jgi:hypothetical protein
MIEASIVDRIDQGSEIMIKGRHSSGLDSRVSGTETRNDTLISCRHDNYLVQGPGGTCCECCGV